MNEQMEYPTREQLIECDKMNDINLLNFLYEIMLEDMANNKWKHIQDDKADAFFKMKLEVRKDEIDRRKNINKILNNY